MDATIQSNYRSIGMGARIDVPHEKLTIVIIHLIFWNIIIVFGGKIGKGETHGRTS